MEDENSSASNKASDEAKVDGGQEHATEYLDFQLSMACASMTESGKHIRRSYLLSVLFLAFGSVLVIGASVEEQVAVPIVGIKLERHYAAYAALLLSCASFYSLVSAKGTERLLSLKVDALVAARYGVEAFHWYLYYPSVFTSPELPGTLSKWGKASQMLPALAVILLLFGPVGLAMKAAADSSWTPPAIVAVVACAALQLVSVGVIAATPAATADREMVLRRIG